MQPRIKEFSRGHAVQASQSHIFLSTDTAEGVVQIGYDKPEAALLVSSILNAGTASCPGALPLP